MSFPGWPGVAPPQSIAPPPSILAMRGPMSRVTTSRHDYTAKGAEKPAIIVPEGEIKISSRPLEGRVATSRHPIFCFRAVAGMHAGVFWVFSGLACV